MTITPTDPRRKAHLVDFIAVVAIFTLAVFAVPVVWDEVSRIEQARAFLRTGQYAFYWPPLTVLVVALNPFLPMGVIAVRLVNMVLTLPIFWEVCGISKTSLTRAIFYLCIPYFAIVAASGSQQGLMIVLLGYLLLRADWPLWKRALLIAACDAVNPSLVVIYGGAMVVLWGLGKVRVSAVREAMLGYVLTLPLVFAAYLEIGRIVPTLSTNGPRNLFLGNNPGPFFARGVGDLAQVWRDWGLSGTPSYVGAVKYYASGQPLQFLSGMLEKAALFLAPFDHMRGGMGGTALVPVFVYIGICQIAIYLLFVRQARRRMTGPMLAALAIGIMAWIVYTIFFVKIRFRIPFDFLLLLSAIHAAALARAGTEAED